ncbi:hypothetical protein BC939DRAFT_270412 [Gamsiella multidivaricata]|uniref:uncharacterized protein n=1 Tax=Gamsiella multidivaricata TaxID=101098 RepID=UPI0022210558|nr:uncharacterized protein BC939DRAFT_270412 [Gamsiella multidivaricata]KAI7819163.1 hypothetical protein BC939DRAFT_270412 [Gamsiella multidivaricata]
MGYWRTFHRPGLKPETRDISVFIRYHAPLDHTCCPNTTEFYFLSELIACVYCRRSHMTCDDGRPCQRCIKRNIGHMCHDEPKPSVAGSATAQQSTSASSSNAGTPAPTGGTSRSPEARRTSQQAQGGQQFNQQHQLTQGLQQQQQQQQQLQNSNLNNMQLYGFNNQLAALPVTPLTFASEHMGNEFTVISDFLRSLGGDNQNIIQDAGIPVNTTEKFFLTAADPSDGTNEDRLTQVINAKFEAGFLKPYNYVNGYTRLQIYMDSNMSNISRQRILNVMGTFRPAFRTVAQTLTDIDLVLVEEAFERLLLDYDRVFSSMGIPACLWRRTGEIYKGNKEFASLVNVPLEMLREGRLCIYELMAEESAVNYWEKYGNIAFDAGQKAVLTSCLLKNPDPESQNVISCCFSFTIRRDKYNIPTVIVGNFLPVSLG